MKQNYSYLLIEAALLGFVELLAFTALRAEYLFQWAGHNWKFYLILGVIALFFVFMNKKFLSLSMTTGIVLGIFVGNFLGKVIRLNNMSKITEGMSAEEKYRLSHHPGFEIWMGIILLSIVAGLMIQTILRKKRG